MTERPKTAKRAKGPSFRQVLSWGWKLSPKRATTPTAASAEEGLPGKRVRGKRRGRKGDAAVPGPPGRRVGERELVQKRDELARQFAELQWDLGGIAYEMASRDQYRVELLNKQAAKLQEVDAQLGQIERVMKLDEAGAAGTCPSCGALQARGAIFCWRCGKELKPASKGVGEAKPATEAAKPATEAAKPATEPNAADKA